MPGERTTVLVNLRRQTHYRGRPRRSPYREYAGQSGLPRASSGSQLAQYRGQN
jgi:hypothetical protein